MTNNNIHPGTLSVPTLITDITGDKRRHLALITLRSRLKLEIRTGMASSRGVSLILSSRSWGYKGPKSKKAALAWVESELENYSD